VDFGLEESGLPGWRLDLGEGHALLLRGRIDRVDLCRTPESDGALAVVIDYKATERKIDPIKLHHGLELQLLAYLGVLRHLANPRGRFDADKLLPAGVFYVNLRGAHRPSKTRAEVLNAPAEERALAYQHLGRFNGQFLRYFDQRGAHKGDQFRYAKNQKGEFSKRANDALEPREFLQLLDDVEAHLGRIGRAIFEGQVRAAPYRKGNETACAYCDYRPICRFDPWIEPYRILQRPSPRTLPLPHLAK
jgi:ATP-dependent helicase/nuclease subunit B